jgi:hypothetical protein
MPPASSQPQALLETRQVGIARLYAGVCGSGSGGVHAAHACCNRHGGFCTLRRLRAEKLCPVWHARAAVGALCANTGSPTAQGVGHGRAGRAAALACRAVGEVCRRSTATALLVVCCLSGANKQLACGMCTACSMRLWAVGIGLCSWDICRAK